MYLFIYFFCFRILTCIYRNNSLKLKNDVKLGRENLLQKTEKLRQVGSFYFTKCFSINFFYNKRLVSSVFWVNQRKR